MPRHERRAPRSARSCTASVTSPRSPRSAAADGETVEVAAASEPASALLGPFAPATRPIPTGDLSAGPVRPPARRNGRPLARAPNGLGPCHRGAHAARRWGGFGAAVGTPVTPAILFVVVGLLVGPEVLGEIDLESSSGTVRALAEATLALVLFCDASRIDLGQLRREVGVPVRLLGIGLPLTIALGAVAAAVIFDRLSVEEAVILAIVLAPTDAALGQAVVTEPRVPGRIRQGLNVESGLNDGICVPLLFAAVAAADVTSEISDGRSAGTLLLEEIGYGVVGGVVGGLVVATIIIHAGRRGLIASRVAAGHPRCRRCSRVQRIAVALHGSGFIAAFVGAWCFARRSSVTLGNSTSSARKWGMCSTASPSCSSGRFCSGPPSAS